MIYQLPPDGHIGRKRGVIRYNTKPCAFPDCENQSHSRGLCTGHWRQWSKGQELAPLKVHRRVIDGFKVCSLCEVRQPVTEYHRKKQYVQEICKSCKSIQLRAKTYGMTMDEVREMLKQPCNACGREVRGREAHIDHCHERGHVRGLLCHNCNVALGAVNDDVDVLRGLIDYIERQR